MQGAEMSRSQISRILPEGSGVSPSSLRAPFHVWDVRECLPQLGGNGGGSPRVQRAPELPVPRGAPVPGTDVFVDSL